MRFSAPIISHKMDDDVLEEGFVNEVAEGAELECPGFILPLEQTFDYGNTNDIRRKTQKKKKKMMMVMIMDDASKLTDNSKIQ